MSSKIDLTKSPENMYLWGYLWADGYFYKKTIHLEIVKTDMDDIKNIIPNYYKFYSRIRKNRKPQEKAYTSNKEIFYFLTKNGYSDKDQPSDYLLDDKLSYLWYRGLVDGDGCWYFNKKNKCRQFYISSNYEQNWKFIEDLLNSLNCTYSIQRIITKKNHKYSCIRTMNKDSIRKIYNYLYQDNLHIGLSRKFKKAQLLINN